MIRMALTRYLTDGSTEIAYKVTVHVGKEPDDAKRAYDQFKDTPPCMFDLPDLGGEKWRDMTHEEAEAYQERVDQDRGDI